VAGNEAAIKDPEGQEREVAGAAVVGSEQGSSGLGTNAIIAIAVSLAVAALVAAAVGYAVYRRRQASLAASAAAQRSQYA
jgi:hypothetical protein